MSFELLCKLHQFHLITYFLMPLFVIPSALSATAVGGVLLDAKVKVANIVRPADHLTWMILVVTVILIL
jgi:hypothetical protein